MEQGILTTVVLPLSLILIMWGLGLSLTIADFKRAAEKPVPVLVGLVCQLVVLPLLGFAVAGIFGLSGALAMGLLILTLCPGGVTSNMISFLAKGDLALSITLTAISSLVTPFTVPLVAAYGFTHFGLDAEEFSLPIGKTMLTLVAVTIVPVAIGMVIRKFKPGFAKRAERPVRIASAIVLGLVIIGIVAKNWASMGSYFAQAGLAALVLNVASMSIGFMAAKLLKLSRPQSITIGIEVGIQNGTTALMITGTLLANDTMSIPPAVYSLIMFGTGAAFGYLMNRGQTPEAAAK